jgi:hypothetical protein
LLESYAGKAAFEPPAVVETGTFAGELNKKGAV